MIATPMMTSAGWIGAVGGTTIGLLGGILGTYFAIRNTNSERERRFMIRMSLCVWFIILAFIAAILVVPMPYRALFWLFYPAALVSAIRFMNRRQTEIQNEESSGEPARQRDDTLS